MKRIAVFLMSVFALALMPAHVMAIMAPTSKEDAKIKEKKGVEPEPAKPLPAVTKPTPEADKPKVAEETKNASVAKPMESVPPAIAKPVATVEPEIYKFKVDYRLDLKSLIKAGPYSWVHWDIRDQFGLAQSHEIVDDLEVVLLRLDRAPDDYGWVSSEMKARGMEPIDIRELMSFGAAYPEVQRSYWVVALGSHLGTTPRWTYPFLDRHGQERIVNLLRDTSLAGWNNGLRFAAVVRRSRTEPAQEAYKVTVNCGWSLNRVVENGEYRESEDVFKIDHHSLACKSGEVEIRFVYLDNTASTSTVLEELDHRSLRAATLHELAALGSMYPNLQRLWPIVALGSWFIGSANAYNPKNDPLYPVLVTSEYGRELRLRYGDRPTIWFRGSVRFAAVRKQ